jgi:hypothetical protein
MDSGPGPVAERELLGEDPVRLPRLREAATDLRRGTPTVRHRGWWISLVVVVVVAGSAFGVDAQVRSREGAQVARCEQQLRLATGYAEKQLGLIANYLEPTLTPGGRVQELHLADLMSTRASRVLPRVQRADRVCHHVSVSPWHFSLVERQSAATAYSAALTAVVQTVAAQGRIPFSDDASLQHLRNQVGIDGG